MMKMLWLFFVLAPSWLLAQQNHSFARKYVAGEKYRYKMTTEYSQNNEWKSTTEAVCELTVIKDSNNIPYDEIRWLSKKTFSATDTTDETKEATLVKPYRISLDPKGTMAIPTIEQPGMTGPITDFNTFFVAISPQMNVATLQHTGDNVLAQPAVKGNFSNGKNILKGEDCLCVSLSLLDNARDKVVLLTTFTPPGRSCLTYLSDDMKRPVIKDTMNNFQMVMPAGNDKFNVQYGREFFNITSTIKKRDGKIQEATMINELKLKLKLNCDNTYKACLSEMPFSIQRTVTIELLH
jgi:hypothetical protein